MLASIVISTAVSLMIVFLLVVLYSAVQDAESAGRGSIGIVPARSEESQKVSGRRKAS